MAFTTIWFTQHICEKLISLNNIVEKSTIFVSKSVFGKLIKTDIHGKKLSFKST